MELPLVTCGFTTFNAQKTILRAINSAINQTYKNIEIVVVDDYSEDNTYKILRELSNENNIKIRIFRHKFNKGVAETRNMIINRANGEYLAFFDDDDVSYPERINEQIKLINKFEKLSLENQQEKKSPLCFTNRNIIYESQKIMNCKSAFVDLNYVSSSEAALAFLSARNFPKNAFPGSTATCTLCAKLKTLRSIDGFNKELRRYEDLDFAIRALQKNVSIISSANILVDQYFTNTSEKKNSSKYEFILIKSHEKFLREEDLFDFALLYVKLKNSLLNFSFLNSVFYLIKIFSSYPLKSTLKIFSATRTITFTLLNKIYSK